jgi:y4mF family transcriptional regulator
LEFSLFLHPIRYNIMTLGEFVKAKRNAVRLTQPELAEKAGVGLRFVRELEQGKESIRLDKVNQVLKLFGSEVGPVVLKSNEKPR